MLFNSHAFIFGFLPAALVLFFLVGGARRPRLALGLLFCSSLFFYAWWNPAYLGVIAASVVFNYSIGVAMAAVVAESPLRRSLLILGVTGNLGLLGYYKYANFFVDNANALLGSEYHLAPIFLPLAISFFTFQQIAYLVDAYRGRFAERSFLDYAVFVTFFPQLIAGPIVHHREMLPQFHDPEILRFRRSNLEIGLTIFFIGLFKKVVLADGVAACSTPVFDAAAAGGSLTLVEAWSGALGYTLQLYFDFSGYSDMAIGLGRLFGLRLPINFDSPYKATNIIDFWRRWHMTLSRFLRDYLYIPLGGNRHGSTRRYGNLMITMLLGGLWHGAGWTFVIWGGLHGVYLLVNHAWRGLAERAGWSLPGGAGAWLSRGLTFLAVVVAWVFFRAEDLDAALGVLSAMVGLGASGLPAAWTDAPPPLFYLPLLLAIAWLAPNTQEFMNRYDPVLKESLRPGRRVYTGALRWRPTRGWALVMAFVTVWGVLGINKLSEFLYFQF